MYSDASGLEHHESSMHVLDNGLGTPTASILRYLAHVMARMTSGQMTPGPDEWSQLLHVARTCLQIEWLIVASPPKFFYFLFGPEQGLCEGLEASFAANEEGMVSVTLNNQPATASRPQGGSSAERDASSVDGSAYRAGDRVRYFGFPASVVDSPEGSLQLVLDTTELFILDESVASLANVERDTQYPFAELSGLLAHDFDNQGGAQWLLGRRATDSSLRRELVSQSLEVLRSFVKYFFASWFLGAWVTAEPERLLSMIQMVAILATFGVCLLYTSPSPRDGLLSRMPSSA